MIKEPPRDENGQIISLPVEYITAAIEETVANLRVCQEPDAEWLDNMTSQCQNAEHDHSKKEAGERAAIRAANYNTVQTCMNLFGDVRGAVTLGMSAVTFQREVSKILIDNLIKIQDSVHNHLTEIPPDILVEVAEPILIMRDALGDLCSNVVSTSNACLDVWDSVISEEMPSE